MAKASAGRTSGRIPFSRSGSTTGGLAPPLYGGVRHLLPCRALRGRKTFTWAAVLFGSHGPAAQTTRPEEVLGTRSGQLRRQGTSTIAPQSSSQHQLNPQYAGFIRHSLSAFGRPTGVGGPSTNTPIHQQCLRILRSVRTMRTFIFPDRRIHVGRGLAPAAEKKNGRGKPLPYN